MPVPVQGYCPSCGEETLAVLHNRVVCSNKQCSDPESAHLILVQEHLDKHLVQITWDPERGRYDASTQHPLIERIEGTLLTRCPWVAYMEHAAPHYKHFEGDGLYTCHLDDTDGWVWKKVE